MLAPRAPVALLSCLFYERAWRDPKLSRRLLTVFGKALQSSCGAADAAWRAIVATRRQAPADKPNHRYWQGPAAFHAAKGPWMWQRSDIEDLAKELYGSRAQVDADAFVTKLSGLPYVYAYFAFTYLPMAETLGIIKLHNGEKRCHDEWHGARSDQHLSSLGVVQTHASLARRGQGLLHAGRHDAPGL